MQFNSIPASNIAAIYPAVIGGGGNPLGLNTTLLVASAIYPNYEYSNADTVGQHYGLNSDVHNFAIVYFKAFEGATTRPNSLFISGYNKEDVEAKLIGGNVSTLTIAQLQAITGTLSIVVDGVEKSGTIDLSAATSFSNAANLIGTALDMGIGDVYFDSKIQAFIISSSSTGAASTISFASGTAADKLMLTQATGALINNDTAIDTGASAAKRALRFSRNFVNFTYAPETMGEEDIKDLATWVTQQNSNFKLYTWGLDPLALSQSGTSFGEWALENTEGVSPIYGSFDKAAFFCGVSASINYNERNGRQTTMFRTQAGLVAEVTDEQDAATLAKNGYSFYGAWATANNRFQMAGIGSVTGKFKWIDNFDFQVFLNSQFQLSFVNMLRANGVTSYTDEGIARVRAYAQDTVNQGINFGGIVAGVTLDESQRLQVNQEAYEGAADLLETQGWVLYVALPNAQTRTERKSFIIKFFYTDGSAMQKLEMSSINVQ